MFKLTDEDARIIADNIADAINYDTRDAIDLGPRGSMLDWLLSNVHGFSQPIPGFNSWYVEPGSRVDATFPDPRDLSTAPHRNTVPAEQPHEVLSALQRVPGGHPIRPMTRPQIMAEHMPIWAEHNFPCPTCTGYARLAHMRIAVFDTSDASFHPCDRCSTAGWKTTYTPTDPLRAKLRRLANYLRLLRN